MVSWQALGLGPGFHQHPCDAHRRRRTPLRCVGKPQRVGDYGPALRLGMPGACLACKSVLPIVGSVAVPPHVFAPCREQFPKPLCRIVCLSWLRHGAW
jgi:hypothetical protein